MGLLLKPLKSDTREESLTCTFAGLWRALLPLFLTLLWVPILPCYYKEICFKRQIITRLLKHAEHVNFVLPCCSRLLSVRVFFNVSLCCWKLLPKKKRTYRQLLVIYINYIILEHYLCLDWTITTWPETTNITNPKLLQAYYCFSFST